MNQILIDNWKIQSSKKITESGRTLTNKNFNDKDWYKAKGPVTVLQALVENGIYTDPYKGKRLEKIPAEEFSVPWWYRSEFELTAEESRQTSILFIEGINYQANIWLNGNLIADNKLIYGAFRQFKIDIGDFLITGKNIFAVEVIPPKPGDFSIGFVDWNQKAPDRNMGIFRNFSLHFNDGVSIANPFVETKLDLKDFREARLSVSAELENHLSETVEGVLIGKIEAITFAKKIRLAANEKKEIHFTVDEFDQLIIDNPRVWQPNLVGVPHLYPLKLQFTINDAVSDECEIKFGIREVEDYITEEGHRGYIINGRKLLIKGAGWTDDLFLGDTPEKIEAQVKYAKDMNLNCIRLEGIWGKDQTLYDLADQYGMLLIVGWSCHWEHEIHLGAPVDHRFGGVSTPEAIDLVAKSWEDQVVWLRHHPSIFVWTVASDMVPHPDLERRYVKTFEKYDRTRPYLNSTGGIGSEQGIITDTEVISDISGSSCVKMLGPYDHTPPVYWYTNKHLGGAYGFNTETCPGGAVPPLESIKKMLPETHLWPPDSHWDYHCGLYEFATLERFKEALDKRYGESANVDEFARKAQAMNYELMRPMFEAFQCHKGKATGIIQWMLNSALPNIYWQLYDWYLMPTGAYYGAKKACEPLHLLYNYGDNSVYFINDLETPVKQFKALIRIYDINSVELLNKTRDINADADSSIRIFEIPAINNLSMTYFLDLRLLNNNGEEIGNNFYWLSRKEDVLDYDAVLGDFTFHTPSKEFADLKQLNDLPKTELEVREMQTKNNTELIYTLALRNKSDKISFLTELHLIDAKSGESVLPVIWSDNYISLLPGESRKVKAHIELKYLPKDNIRLKINGFNG